MCSLLDLPLGNLSSIVAQAGSDAAMACWDVCTALQGAIQDSPPDMWKSIEITDPRATKSSDFVRLMRPPTLVVNARTCEDLRAFFKSVGNMTFVKELTVRITHSLFGEDPFEDSYDDLVGVETLRVLVPSGIVGILQLRNFGRTYTEIRAPSAVVNFTLSLRSKGSRSSSSSHSSSRSTSRPFRCPPAMTLVCVSTDLFGFTDLFAFGVTETLFETLHVNAGSLLSADGFSVLPHLRIRDLILNIWTESIIVSDGLTWPAEMRSLTMCVSPYTTLVLGWRGIETIERVSIISDDILSFYVELVGDAPPTWVAEHLEIGSGGKLILS